MDPRAFLLTFVFLNETKVETYERSASAPSFLHERTLGLFNVSFGSSRIANPAYQEWPTNDAAFWKWRVQSSDPPVSPIQSLRIDEGHYAPHFTNHSLYLMKLLLVVRRCYPKGNFGGNQLLGSSISLSPLCPDSTINLHVRTAASLHQGFPWLHPLQA